MDMIGKYSTVEIDGVSYVLVRKLLVNLVYYGHGGLLQLLVQTATAGNGYPVETPV